MKPFDLEELEKKLNEASYLQHKYFFFGFSSQLDIIKSEHSSEPKSLAKSDRIHNLISK
jgi:hypothetical protein